MNREDWLIAALESFVRPLFQAQGLETPTARVSIGFPSTRALSTKNRAIGQCWSATCSKDKLHQIFVSPVVDDSVEVLGTLVHEYLHASLGTKVGHRAPFKRAALALGLAGPMKATVPGPDLAQHCAVYVESVGPIPHAALNALDLKKQGTRLIKLECPSCGYTIRTTQKWIDVGVPTCMCGDTFRRT